MSNSLTISLTFQKSPTFFLESRTFLIPDGVFSVALVFKKPAFVENEY
ncbi:MAG: hypothetical protein ACI85O_001153 [Saprospiraceae bacterium]|jgi:hypothetical protein